MGKYKYSFEDYEIFTCSDCPCSTIQDEHTKQIKAFCTIEMRFILTDMFREKPKWCPLKEEGKVVKYN